jgi:hypothetical protein
MWTKRSGLPATDRFPGQRRKKLPVRFASTSPLSMQQSALRRMAVETAGDRAAVAIDASPPKKCP